ncbi:Scn11a [Symbiodinium pilosum]|uniref:Scn11a protein n=1 Tax=Symbiodinium pilosum TaxID=2952 RepID=A0A812WD18_SYMPI|nr:Scn11a [Symbiodinium pilosum]
MEENAPKVLAHFEEVLESHQLQLLARMDSWLQSLDARLERSAQVRRSAEEACQSSKDFTDFEKRRRSPVPQLQQSKSMNSYDRAQLTHTRVVQQSENVQPIRRDSRRLTALNVCQSYAKWIVDSQCCNLFFGLAVVTNSMLLGIHLEFQAVTRDFSSGVSIFATLHTLYSLLFTVEVCLRLTADGCRKYIWESLDWAWNWLDVFVVLSSWVELASELLNHGQSSTSTNSNLRILRLLRVGKLVRVVRVFRVVKFFRSLRTLVQSLLGTMKALFWAMLLLALIIYIFAIVFTDAVIDHVQDLQVVKLDDDVLEAYFGTLYDSYLTLFRSISNGVTWGEPASALSSIPEGHIWVQFFHFYIAFCSFAVLNVMTGVFCNSAIKAAERDHEMLVMSLVQSRRELKDQVASLFHKIDERGLGQVTIPDFEKHFDDDAVIAFFESLEIGAMDAWTLFMSLDMDGDHTISVEEFTEQCVKLHGPARSADLYALRQLTDKHSKQLNLVLDFQKRFNRRLEQLSKGAPLKREEDDEIEVLKHWL